MRYFMEKTHFEQARVWLEGAQDIAQKEAHGRDKYNVAIAMCIHAIIKANDALTIKFLNVTAKRHDDARRLFEELIKRNVIKSEHAPYKQIIQEAINHKSDAEYKGSFFSKNDFERISDKAEKFIKMVGGYV